MVPTNFYAMSDVVVMYTDPEFADYDNPRGNIYGYASYVVAVDKRGYRRRLHVCTEHCNIGNRRAMEPAERMASALTNRLANGKLPVGWDNWDYYHPEYGSEAYIVSGEEDNLIQWEYEMDGMERY